MSGRSNSQLARVVAILALMASFVVVVAVVATSARDSGSNDESSSESALPVSTAPTEPTTRAGEKAVERGFYVVRQGDTLIVISAATGIPQETIEELNPKLDPQALIPGQKIRLD